MNLVASSFWTALVASACVALAACSGASNGIGNGNGNQTCTNVPCGANGATYSACSTPASGGCSNLTYSANGQTESCNTCTGCAQAVQTVVAACVNEPVDGGGSDASGTCAAAHPCGGGGRTYQECTISGPDGTCTSIDYKTSDGRNFTCAGCMNCASVAENLQNYCATAPTDGGGGNTSCSTAVSCGNTGTTYEECTTTATGGICTSIEYNVSNGVSYTCASCGNCTAALESLEAYCAGTGNPTTACTASSPCGTSSLDYQQCTTSLNGTCESIYYLSSDNQMFTCNSCGDCSTALTSLESYCDSTVTPVTNCAAPAACGNGSVTYELCTTTTGSTCTSEYYSTSDGNTFTCSGCDCSSASTQLSSYCASLDTGNVCNPVCTTGTMCCNCGGTMECLGTGTGITCASYSCM